MSSSHIVSSLETVSVNIFNSIFFNLHIWPSLRVWRLLPKHEHPTSTNISSWPDLLSLLSHYIYTSLETTLNLVFLPDSCQYPSCSLLIKFRRYCGPIEMRTGHSELRLHTRAHLEHQTRHPEVSVLMVGSLSSFYFCLSFYFYSSVLYGLLASKQAMGNLTYFVWQGRGKDSPAWLSRVFANCWKKAL